LDRDEGARQGTRSTPEPCDAEGIVDTERELAELNSSDPKLVALDARHSSIMKGDAPQENAERLALAQYAYNTKRFPSAAKLFAGALEADSKLGEDRQNQIRYNAACCSALGATSVGKNELPVDNVARTMLRKQALEWPTTVLTTWSNLLGIWPP
jgi:hypothetical protein